MTSDFAIPSFCRDIFSPVAHPMRLKRTTISTKLLIEILLFFCSEDNWGQGCNFAKLAGHDTRVCNLGRKRGQATFHFSATGTHKTACPRFLFATSQAWPQTPPDFEWTGVRHPNSLPTPDAARYVLIRLLHRLEGRPYTRQIYFSSPHRSGFSSAGQKCRLTCCTRWNQLPHSVLRN